MKVLIKDVHPIFVKIIDTLDLANCSSLTDELKLRFDINIIDNRTPYWKDDELFFHSEQDYFLFLLQWS